MCDLFDEEIFEQKLRRLAQGFQKRFGDLLKYDVDEEIARYKVRKYQFEQSPEVVKGFQRHLCALTNH